MKTDNKLMLKKALSRDSNINLKEEHNDSFGIKNKNKDSGESTPDLRHYSPEKKDFFNKDYDIKKTSAHKNRKESYSHDDIIMSQHSSTKDIIDTKEIRIKILNPKKSGFKNKESKSNLKISVDAISGPDDIENISDISKNNFSKENNLEYINSYNTHILNIKKGDVKLKNIVSHSEDSDSIRSKISQLTHQIYDNRKQIEQNKSDIKDLQAFDDCFTDEFINQELQKKELHQILSDLSIKKREAIEEYIGGFKSQAQATYIASCMLSEHNVKMNEDNISKSVNVISCLVGLVPIFGSAGKYIIRGGKNIADTINNEHMQISAKRMLNQYSTQEDFIDDITESMYYIVKDQDKQSQIKLANDKASNMFEGVQKIFSKTKSKMFSVVISQAPIDERSPQFKLGMSDARDIIAKCIFTSKAKKMSGHDMIKKMVKVILPDYDDDHNLNTFTSNNKKYSQENDDNINDNIPDNNLLVYSQNSEDEKISDTNQENTKPKKLVQHVVNKGGCHCNVKCVIFSVHEIRYDNPVIDNFYNPSKNITKQEREEQIKQYLQYMNMNDNISANLDNIGISNHFTSDIT